MDYRLKMSKLIEDKRITKRELALKINKNENTIANYISGKTNIEVDVLLKMAEIFGVPVSHFFEESGTGGNIVQTANGNGNSQNIALQNQCSELQQKVNELNGQVIKCQEELIQYIKMEK